MSESKASVVGTISFEVCDALTGERIPAECGSVSNIVTDVGLVQLAKILSQAPYSTNYEIALGTGSTTAAATDTSLEVEVFRGAPTAQTATAESFRVKLFLGVADANGYTVSEAGLLHDLVLIDRALLIPTIVKTPSKTVTIQIDLTLSR